MFSHDSDLPNSETRGCLLHEVLAIRAGTETLLTELCSLPSVFLLTRNDTCILGSYAEPLSYKRSGRRRVAWSDALTVQFSNRRQPMMVSYRETGGDGRELDGIEMLDARHQGCLKFCRTVQASELRWTEILSSRILCRLHPESLQGMRKTNHLASFSRNPGEGSRILEHIRGHWQREMERVFANGDTLEVLVPCGVAKALLRFVPKSFSWRGVWCVLTDRKHSAHFLLTPHSSLVINEKENGIRVLDLFETPFRLSARLIVRSGKRKTQPIATV